MAILSFGGDVEVIAMKLSDFWTETTETQTHEVDREAETREDRQIREWGRFTDVVTYWAVGIGLAFLLISWLVTR